MRRAYLVLEPDVEPEPLAAPLPDWPEALGSLLLEPDEDEPLADGSLEPEEEEPPISLEPVEPDEELPLEPLVDPLLLAPPPNDGSLLCEAPLLLLPLESASSPLPQPTARAPTINMTGPIVNSFLISI